MKAPEEMAEEYAEGCWTTEEMQYAAYRGYFAGYKAAENHFRDATEMVGPQWISVKDRLPEEDVAVLVYGEVLNDPPDIIGVRRRYNGDQEWKHTWESEDGFIYSEDDVTHWMPLPAPPKEEE